MESFTLLCKVHYGVMLNNRISVKITVLVEYAYSKGSSSFNEK